MDLQTTAATTEAAENDDDDDNEMEREVQEVEEINLKDKFKYLVYLIKKSV